MSKLNQIINKVRKTDSVYVSPNPDLQTFEINNWEISKIVLRNIEPKVGTNPFPLNELMLLTGAVARFEPSYIFEWGTHIGKSARTFYEAASALNVKTSIHSIDLPDDIDHVEHPRNERGRLVRDLPNVTLHQGDGLDTALGILAKLKPSERSGKTALFFVDGDHSYDSVKRELTGILKNAPQAKILLHDTFYQHPESRYNVGPYDAISDCLKKTKNSYGRIDTSTGLPGMTLLYPLG